MDVTLFPMFLECVDSFRKSRCIFSPLMLIHMLRKTQRVSDVNQMFQNSISNESLEHLLSTHLHIDRYVTSYVRNLLTFNERRSGPLVDASKACLRRAHQLRRNSELAVRARDRERSDVAVHFSFALGKYPLSIARRIAQ